MWVTSLYTVAPVLACTLKRQSVSAGKAEVTGREDLRATMRTCRLLIEIGVVNRCRGFVTMGFAEFVATHRRQKALTPRYLRTGPPRHSPATAKHRNERRGDHQARRRHDARATRSDTTLVADRPAAQQADCEGMSRSGALFVALGPQWRRRRIDWFGRHQIG